MVGEALPIYDFEASIVMFTLKNVAKYCLRAFAVPSRRFSLYAVGWYLAPYEIVAFVVSLSVYGVIGPGHAAGVVAAVAFVVASAVGGFRVLPHADWTGGFGDSDPESRR